MATVELAGLLPVVLESGAVGGPLQRIIERRCRCGQGSGHARDGARFLTVILVAAAVLSVVAAGLETSGGLLPRRLDGPRDAVFNANSLR